MTKITIGLAVMLVVIAAAFQSIASAQQPPKKSAPAARPAPAVRSAPVARPAAQPRQAPAVRVAPRMAPVARPAAQPRQAPAARVAPRTAPVVRPAAPPRQVPAARLSPRAPVRVISPQNVSPAGAARAMSIRGASRTTISGQNFSVRRDSYRAYRGGRWRTFVGLRALHFITIGAAYYYPYAYIDAPYDYCQGWTEDGCQLSWQAVPTLEGDPEYQCVAYCPWQ